MGRNWHDTRQERNEWCNHENRGSQPRVVADDCQQRGETLVRRGTTHDLVIRISKGNHYNRFVRSERSLGVEFTFPGKEWPRSGGDE